jgi:hypothetical protein
MGLPIALSIPINCSCFLPEIFSVQHAGGIAVFSCGISFILVYRIFTINIIRPNMGLSTPVLIFSRLELKLFDENVFVG